MLEIRYNKNTKELTGWWGDRHGNHEIKLKNRPDEAIALIDTPIPDKPLEALLFDKETLVPNPSYAEPRPPRDFAIELNSLKAMVEGLEKKEI